MLSAARLTAAGRLVIPWLVGPAALMMRDRGVELTGPTPCPGLLEITSIAALRLHPDLPIGPIFDVMHAAVFVAAIAALVALVDRSTRSRAIPAAIGLAVALSPLFGSTLSPPWDAAAFGACAAAALLVSSAFARGSRSARAGVVLVTIAFLACALLVPPWLAVAAAGAAVAGAVVWPRPNQRWIAGAAAAAVLLLIVPAMLNLSRPGVLAGPTPWRGLMSCALPRPSAARALTAIRTLGWWLGPFALGLAALGAVAATQWAGARRAAVPAAAALVCVALAAGAEMNAAVSAAPLAVALWWLAALGLDALVTAIGAGPARAVATAVILLLLPALEASRRMTETRDDRVAPRGHASQTLRRTTTRLDLVAQDAAFVQEDATVDILFRAAVFGGRRRGKPVVVVAPRADVVARALTGRTVYAFPWRQADLSLRGFFVEPLAAGGPASAALEGLATIAGTPHCDTVGATWGAVTASSGRIGVAADSDAAVGPVVMFFGGATPGGAIPDGWPGRTLRGFHARTFDRRQAEDAARLQAEARDAALAPDHPVLTQPAVVRLTLHRTPRAPRAFAVILGAPFPVGAGKLEQGDAASGHFTVCDAPPVAITALPRVPPVP